MKPIVIVGYGNAGLISYYEMAHSLENMRITMGGVAESCEKLSVELIEIGKEFELENFNLEELHSKKRKKSWEKNKFYE